MHPEIVRWSVIHREVHLLHSLRQASRKEQLPCTVQEIRTLQQSGDEGSNQGGEEMRVWSHLCRILSGF